MAKNRVGNCDVFAVVFMNKNTNQLLHQLTRLTVNIWNSRGLLSSWLKRETSKAERDVASPFAIHGTGTRRFIEVYFHITGIILYISRPFLIVLFVSSSWKLCQFLVSRFDGSCGSQIDCVFQRYCRWNILQDRARYTVYQYTCDM